MSYLVEMSPCNTQRQMFYNRRTSQAVLVSPSIISCHLERLEEEVRKCERDGIQSLHLDAMDGHFVPNITMGPDLIKAIRKVTKLKLEAHLMLDRPDKYYKKFKEAGTDSFLIHVESPIETGLFLKELQSQHIGYGVVINPDTPLDAAKPFLPGAELLVIMTVHPGFSGQSFIEGVVPKIREAQLYLRDEKLSARIEVDGGVNDVTAVVCKNAGADVVVSGSYLFSGNINERLARLRCL